MFQKDYDELKKYYSYFEKKYDYHLQEADVGFLKIFSKNGDLISNDKSKVMPPCIDILVYENFNGIIAIKDRATRHMYSKYRFLEKNLLPLQRTYIYKDLNLYGALNPYPYLERCYGEWKKRFHDLKIVYKSKNET